MNDFKLEAGEGSETDKVKSDESIADTENKIEFPSAHQLEKEVKRRKYINSYLKIIGSTLSSLIVVAAIAVLIATLLFPVLRVTGSSMTPTLENDQLIVCKKTGNFEYGDVIAFYYNNKILLKRVIAVSGDTISIDSSGVVTVNGEVLDEPYVSELALGECDLEFPYQVPEQRIFVMGDHRETSIDSRTTQVGCVAEESVIGVVTLRIWPFEKIGSLAYEAE